MKGDFTRFSHRPQRYYAGVLMQQGRVTLDADWNEQLDIEDHRWRVQTIDTIGRACAPADDAGFEISFTPDGSDLIIGEGRIYIDGLLVENRHGAWVRVTEIGERLELADMAPDDVAFEEGQWMEVAWDDPEAGEGSTAGRITEVDDTSVQIDFFEPPDATLENLRARRLVTYLTQPFYRAGPDSPGEWEGRRHLVYLDVWRRHVTAIEDPRMREVALGGPDTATRVQTAWAVRILFDGDEPFDASEIGCHDQLELWDELTAPKAARLSARAEAAPDPEDPCEIKPEAGYRGLENRLYRVEIHDPGPLGTATYKWSRDNGSILASITGFPDPDEIQVHSLGKDPVLRFRAGDPVEVFSDETEMSGLPGTLTAVSGQPDEAERIITLEDDVSVYQNHHTPRVRRWNGGPTTTEDAFVELEKGVQVRFSGGSFQSGDYWLIPARVATGQVEGFIDAPPRGCFHHLARLTLITWPQDVGDVDAPLTFAVTDCRRTFPSLCGLPEGGEGCATVTVGDGVTSVGDFTSIQAAVDAVPAEGPAHISILPGEYVLDEPVRVTQARLTIAGCDDQTRVHSSQGPVFQLDRCAQVRLEQLRLEAADSAGAVLVAASTEVTLQRCTVINGRSRVSEVATHLAGPAGSTLGASIDPAGPAVTVHGSTLVWVLDNRLLGNPAASLQASLARCSGNTMRLGGVWIREGSKRVAFACNELLGGLGAGVALGGLAPGEPPPSRSTGVRQVEISHNRIASMGQAGISTVAGVPPGEDDVVVRVPFERFKSLAVEEAVSGLRDELAVQPTALVRADVAGVDDLRLRPVAALGDVEEVVVASNLITGCGRRDPDRFFDDEATGGIVLREAIGIRILDNEIVDNGLRRRAAGIFLAGCESTEISGNLIRGNGSNAGLHADLMVGRTTQGPNPLVVRGIEFELLNADQSVRMPLFGLLIRNGLQVTLPDPVREVCFTYFSAQQGDLVVRSGDDNSVVEQVLKSGVHTVSVEPGFDFTALELHPRGSQDSNDRLALMSLMQICAGAECRRYQGGIIGVDLAAEDAGRAIGVHGNEIDTPVGQALLLTGAGRIVVADNWLVSRSSTVQSCALEGSVGERFPMSLLPRTVLIYNAGQSALLGNLNLAAVGGLVSRGPGASSTGIGSLGGGFLFERSSEEGDAVLVDSLAAKPEQRDPEGPVLFHGNQVTYRPAGGEFVPASVMIASFDDVAVSDNQMEAEAPDGMILVDAFVRAMTVRAADNALREPPRNAVLSGRLSGLLAHVTGNQATHCIAVTGTLDEVADNQILMEQMSTDYTCDWLRQSTVVSADIMLVEGGS